MLPKIDFKQRPWLKILIHSASIVDIREISSFLELNLTDYIDIDVTPSVNKELTKIFTRNKTDVPEYHIEDGNIAMYYDYGFKNAQFYSDHFEEIITKCKSKVTNDDLLMSKRYDFFIVDESDALHHENPVTNLSTVESVKKFLRIIFSNNGIFLYRHNQFLDEGWYYLIRFKTVFKCYQEPWSIIVYLRDKYPQVYQSMGSLSTRLNFIIRAYEKVGYFALDLDNVDSQRA
ncbi:unnamed protein product, partial [marine sediment metagenome]